tara:strand:- start:8346 stop:8795 length:450 start_codon:yes stop_codon:yes gene_type:complete
MLRKSYLNFEKFIHFGDCDEAGVIHFYQIFKWCHEFWELSLLKSGIQIKDVFPCAENKTPLNGIILPIVNCKANYLAPIRFGDNLNVNLIPDIIDINSFQIKTEFHHKDIKVAEGIIKHCAINSISRKKEMIPNIIIGWLDGSILDKMS